MNLNDLSVERQAVALKVELLKTLAADQPEGAVANTAVLDFLYDWCAMLSESNPPPFAIYKAIKVLRRELAGVLARREGKR